MRFKFIIKKWANFYFFVQNLSEWHPRAVKHYNLFWKKRLGKFSLKEEKALRSFKKIRKNYEIGQTFFEVAFFVSNNPWRVLKDKLSLKEYKKMREIFNLFENKFGLIYKKDLPLLRRWKKFLENKTNEFNKQSLLKEIIRVLSILYNTQPKIKEINVYLLLSSSDCTSGTAKTIDNQSITICVSCFPIEQAHSVLGGMWHEICHLVFEEEYFMPLIRRNFPELLKGEMPLYEIALLSLFPAGVLGQKFFKSPPPNSSYFGAFSQKSSQFLSLMEEYVLQKKPLNKEYLRKLTSLITKK